MAQPKRYVPGKYAQFRIILFRSLVWLSLIFRDMSGIYLRRGESTRMEEGYAMGKEKRKYLTDGKAEEDEKRK